MEKIEKMVRDLCEAKVVDTEEFRAVVEVLRPRAGDMVMVHIVSDAVDDLVVKRVKEHVTRALGGAVGVAAFGYGEDDAITTLCLSPAEIKLLGRCPKCAARGDAHAGALVCPIHGAYTG